MKIAQTQDGYVVSIYQPEIVPYEFIGYLGDTFHILEDFQQGVTIGWRYEGGDFLPPIEVIIPFGKVITVPAYRNRFTRAEKRAIKEASYGTSPSQLDLSSDLDHLASTPYVHLGRAYENKITLGLEQMGLIAEGRSDEILLNPVYSIELLIETRLDLGMTAIPSDEELAANSAKGYASLNEYLAAQTTTNSYEIR